MIFYCLLVINRNDVTNSVVHTFRTQAEAFDFSLRYDKEKYYINISSQFV